MEMKRVLSALLCAVMLMTSVTVLAATNEATPGEATRCDHAGSTIVEEPRDVTYAQDAATHTKSYNLVVVHTCPSCEAGDYEDAPVPTTDPAEAHNFVNGVCSVCGYACQHASHNMDGACTVCGAACAHSFANGACTICGQVCVHSYDSSANNGCCTICGAYCMHNFAGSGVCPSCGFICPHTAHDSEGICRLCGTTCGHTFMNGVCSVCGFACAHASHNIDGTCPVCGAACAHSFTDGACTVCGAPCTHTFVDGKCSVCGACQHRSTRTSHSHENSKAEIEDGKYHLESYDEYEMTVCSDCYTIIGDPKLVEAGVQERNPHYYRDGDTCVVCGYKNTGCTHEHSEEQTYWSREEVVSKDPSGHTIRSNLMRQMACLDCGYISDVATLEKDLMITRAHEMSEGVCILCGYELSESDPGCDHPQVEDEVYYDCKQIISKDENNHTMRAEKVTQKRCQICGEYLDTIREKDQEVTEPHDFYLDRCYVCNYVNPCKHEDTSTETAYSMTYDFTSTADSHSFKGCRLEQVWCNNCETIVSEKIVETNGTYTEQHYFEDGVCMLCGAKETAAPTATPTAAPTATPTVAPTATPTAAPTATPTPAPTAQPADEPDNDFVPTPRPNRVNNVVAAPATEPDPVPTVAPTAAPMVDTLLSAVTDAEAQGSTVTVEVVGAQEIMTETEYTALKTLPAQEQILVTLASIGFEDVVEAATKALSVELSSGAQTLVTQVTERMAAVTQGERAVVEEKLAQYFPVQDIEVNGVKTSYFVIDLKIEVDGVVRVERYGFRLDENGEWVFEKLDLQSVQW